MIKRRRSKITTEQIINDFTVGQRQKHCIGSYASNMGNKIYVTFTHEEKDYQAEITDRGSIYQIKGKRNTCCPTNLQTEIQKVVDKAQSIRGVVFKINNLKKIQRGVKQKC